MVKLLGEQFVTFAKAAEVLPTRPHINTLRRWANKGVGGVVLESWKLGTVRVTTIEALERFLLATSGKQPNRTASNAEQKLDSLGIV